MEIKVFNEKPTIEPILLKLEKSNRSKNGVDLLVVDSDGYALDGGCILSIFENGISRHINVNLDFGFALDVENRIRMV